METERSFLQRRAAEERRAASNAQNPKAQRIHSQMAERYEELGRDQASAI